MWKREQSLYAVIAHKQKHRGIRSNVYLRNCNMVEKEWQGVLMVHR